MIEKTFNSGTLKLNYAEGPDNGLPILLLHGMCARWQTFFYLIPPLEEKFHLYALDLRGHGKSGRSDSYYIDDNVPDIVDFIKNCIKKPVIIFGHSYGGMIGLMLAANYPELVSGLILGDSIISRDFHKEFSIQHHPISKFWRELAQSDSLDFIVSELKNQKIPVPGQQELVPAYQVLGEDHPSFQFAGLCFYQLDPQILTVEIEDFDNKYAQYQTELLYPKIQCPVLLLQANPQRGGLMRDEDVQRAVSLLPTAKQVKIEKAGHMLIVEDPETVLKAAIPFMEAIK